MEDLIGLVVVILYFVIAFAAGKKKKKKPANIAKAKRRAVMEKAFEQAFTVMESENEPSLEPEPVQTMLDLAQEGDDPCHIDMLGEERPAMRAVNVSAAALAQAAEGEDLCHIGDAREADEPVDAYTPETSPIIDTDDRDALAQDILRGVIMSEILARPGGRRVIPQRKRGA